MNYLMELILYPCAVVRVSKTKLVSLPIGSRDVVYQLSVGQVQGASQIHNNRKFIVRRVNAS